MLVSSSYALGTPHPDPKGEATLMCCAFSPCGTLIAAGGSECACYLWSWDPRPSAAAATDAAEAAGSSGGDEGGGAGGSRGLAARTRGSSAGGGRSSAALGTVEAGEVPWAVPQELARLTGHKNDVTQVGQGQADTLRSHSAGSGSPAWLCEPLPSRGRAPWLPSSQPWLESMDGEDTGGRRASLLPRRSSGAIRVARWPPARETAPSASGAPPRPRAAAAPPAPPPRRRLRWAVRSTGWRPRCCSARDWRPRAAPPQRRRRRRRCSIGGDGRRRHWRSIRSHGTPTTHW
jgi:hypothetical protein